MQPVILAITRTKLASGAAIDELLKSAAQSLFETASPDHSVFVYVCGLGASYTVKTEGAAGLALTPVAVQNRTDILAGLSIPGVAVVKEIEIKLPASQILQHISGAQRYGPVLVTKIVANDATGGASNLWPLCVQLNIPVILGVTTKQVISGRLIRPAETYADLLKKNLTTLVKGTSPGHVRHGSDAEDPPPDLFVYGCNFDLTNMMVKPADIPALASLRVNRKFRRSICTVEFDFSVGPIQKKLQFELQELGVAAPTMAELQGSANYTRNAVVMALGVQVVNGARGGDASNAWQVPMWLPMPSLTDVEPDKARGYGNGQRLGQETSANDKGEVRWYFANPFNEQRRPLDKWIPGLAADLQKIPRMPLDDLSEVWNFSTALKDEKTVVLPPALTTVLGTIREAGELCEIDHQRPNCWTDDTLCFRPPFELCYQDPAGHVYDPEQGDPTQGVDAWTPFAYLPAGWKCPICKADRSQFQATADRRDKRMGFAVVWRGDIPSLPLPINLLEYVKDLAQRLWRPVVGSSIPDYTVAMPLPATKAVRLGVERLEDIANELVGMINTVDKNGYGVQVGFAFVTPGLDANNFRSPTGGTSTICTLNDITNFVDTALEPTKTGVGGKLIEFLFDPFGGDFTLQLHVVLQGKIRLFEKDIVIPQMIFPIGPKLRFKPEQLPFPTGAIFFQESDYGGAALVALEPAVLGGNRVHIDANTPGLNQVRVQILDALSRANDALTVLQYFHGSQQLDAITTVIGNICAIGRSVVDSNGKIENVSDYYFSNDWLGSVFGKNSFNDDISSVVMIGKPANAGGKTVKCWQNSLRRSDLGMGLELKMPDDQFVLTMPRFDKIPRSFFNPNTLQGVPATQTEINFDNMLTGIEIV